MPTEHRVQFLRQECGEFPGQGPAHVPIPVDAMTTITRNAVTINHEGEQLHGAVALN